MFKPQAMSDYQLIFSLGSDQISQISLSKEISTGKVVVLKSILASKLENSSDSSSFSFFALPYHPFIASIIASFSSPGRFNVVFEYPSGPSILSSPFKTMEHLKSAFSDIATALEFVHSHGVLLGNLKPEQLCQKEDGTFQLGIYGFLSQSHANSEADDWVSFCNLLFAAVLGKPGLAPICPSDHKWLRKCELSSLYEKVAKREINFHVIRNHVFFKDIKWGSAVSSWMKRLCENDSSDYESEIESNSMDPEIPPVEFVAMSCLRSLSLEALSGPNEPPNKRSERIDKS